MNVCLICEAPYFVYGKFGPCIYNVSRISLLEKKKMAKKKTRHHTDFEADQKPKGCYFVTKPI